MKFPFIPKTLLWEPKGDRKRKEKKGIMTIISVFLFLIFTTLGLSMLFLSQIYFKLSVYKKNSTLLAYASENGIKHGFDNLLDLLSQSASPSLLAPGETDELLINTRNKGSEILERLLGTNLLLQNFQSWENMSWKSVTNFYLEDIEEEKNFFHVSYKALILSEGTIKNFKQTKESSLESLMGIFAGNIPLSSIPLLIDKKLEPGQKEKYANKNKIKFHASKMNRIPPQISFSEGALIPKEANSLMGRALKIKIFRPQDLTIPLLRAVLGLEETIEPVPDGVYLIEDNTGLGGIFVQGDLEEMVLAIDGDFQIVSFLSKQGCWVLRFNPSRSKTIFSTPEETHFHDLIPLGIIIVNGEICSLGGGTMDYIGQVALEEEEIPSLLGGVNLTIISSDKITLSSHLIQQGVKWIDGVPYVKHSDSQLAAHSTGKDFLGNTQREGKISIDRNSPEKLIIQASLTAPDKGFSIEGKNKTVHILGSLQASDYFSNGNTLEITFDERFTLEKNLTQNVIKTAKPVLYLSSFKLLVWKEL